MRLFWQVYLASLSFVLFSMAVLTSVVSVQDSQYSLAALRNEQRLLAVTAASQVEAGYHEDIWPFGMLWAISREPEFAFWEIVDSDGKSVLSDGALNTKFGGAGAPRSTPRWAAALGSPRSEVEEWVVPMELGDSPNAWLFRLGFKTTHVRAHVWNTIRTNVLVALGISLLLFAVSFWFTHRLLQPLRSLTLAATELESGHLDLTLPAETPDEFGQLMRAFGSMAASLRRDIRERERAEAERKEMDGRLLQASRQAGMVEVATSVLHNVGNVLNSVNVSATVLSENLRESKVERLARVCALMKDNAENLGAFVTTHPSGMLLPAYLSELSRVLEAERAAAMTELSSLLGNIDHIKAVVTQQQQYARITSDVVEDVDLGGLCDDALRIVRADLSSYRIEVVRDYVPLPAMRADRNKLLQIVVNLLSNAKHALSSNQGTAPRLFVETGREPDGMQFVRIVDNGVGIAAENLLKIFNYGFTTKKGGHGFGLHSAALAAAQMGGALSADSRGPGQGAAFVLRIPTCKADSKPPEDLYEHAS